MAEHSNQLQRDLIAAHHEIARRDNLIASQDKRLRDANREVSVLTRALEARATELGLDGSRDVRKGLLYEVRRARYLYVLLLRNRAHVARRMGCVAVLLAITVCAVQGGIEAGARGAGGAHGYANPRDAMLVLGWRC